MEREKEVDTRRKIALPVMFGSAIVMMALYCAGEARAATPAVGFSATTLAQGTFGEIDIFSRSIFANSGEDERRAKEWLSLQKTKGPFDLYVQSNVWLPGGSTGWHIHSGRSLIIVKEGTVTEYDGHDPACTARVYTKGMAFVDPGGEHVHLIRNEGTDVAQTTAVQLIPSGATRRIDVADPGNCHF